MKPLLVLLSVAVLGLGAFGVAWSLSSQSTPIAAAPVGDPLSPDVVAELRTLREESAAMRKKISDLEMRQAALESRSEGVSRRPANEGASLVPADAVSMDDVRELVAAIQNPAAPGTKFEELVSNVIDAREERAREERLQRRREQTEQRVSDRVDEMSEQLGLTVTQSTEMKAILVDERVQRDEMFTKMREDGNFDRNQMRTMMGQLREGIDTRLKGVLTPVQFDQYQEMDDNNPWNRGRGGRRNNNDNGGGNNGNNNNNNDGGSEGRRRSRA